MSARVRLAAAVIAVAALTAPMVLTGCTKGTGSAGPGTIDVTETETHTLPPSTITASSPPQSTYHPAPASSVAALGAADAPMPAGETEGPCPYIANQDVADIEGDHVYRSAVITTTKPNGCRFYFYASPFEAVADIVPMTFPTATDAYNAMIATAKAGTENLGVKDLVPGVDAVLFKTTFFGQDGPDADWACVFAKGTVLVVVHTQQTNVSFNARSLAEAVAPKF